MNTIPKIIHIANSKLIASLQLLSAKEFKELEYWLQSPWCKQHKKILLFYQILQKITPDYAPENLIKEDLCALLSKNKTINNKTFNNLLSEFTKQVESYLAHLHFQKNKTLQQRSLVTELLERKQVFYFEKSAQNLIQQLEKKTTKSAEDAFLLHQLYQQLYFQPSEHRRYQPKAEELSKSAIYLDTYYLLTKLKYAHENQSRVNILKEALHLEKEAETVYLFALQQKLKLPAAALYQFRLTKNTTTNWQDYLAFKDLYLNCFSQLHSSLQQVFLYCCINSVVALNSQGQPNTIQALFEWYQFGLQQGLLMQMDIISSITYNNIILTACHLNETAFLLDFVEVYQHKLPENIQKDALIWSKAHVAYILGDYETAVDTLKDATPEQTLYAIQIKSTLLKANFRWALVDATQGFRFNKYCLAFEKYIHRNDLYSKDRSIAILKYIQYTRRMVSLYHSTTEVKKWRQLLATIHTEPILFGKRWLKKEMERLMKEKGIPFEK